jgi:hypothetical protein
MLRLSLLGFWLCICSASTICAQEMRTVLREYGLAGHVQSVETTLVDMSTKSYKLRPGGREALDDFGNPSAGSPNAPLLWEILKFDAKGRLVEDIDLERPVIEQESYRYVYTYNQQGLLTERAGYREDNSPDEKNVYIFGPKGEKIEQLNYSAVGRLESRYEFDDHQNIASIEWYGDDGKVRRKESHRYEYLSKGNTLEQIYYPPEVPPGIGFTSYAPLGADAERPAKVAIPNRYRTVFVRDDAGQLREETRYLPDGSLHEKKVFDEKGILRNKEWRVGEATVTTTICDDQGREIESHTIAKKGFGSPRAVDDRTLFSYDEHGNLTKMVTSGPDGSLVGRTTSIFEYDNHGNWVTKTETVLNNTWQTQPFLAAFETIRQFHRAISYFPEH